MTLLVALTLGAMSGGDVLKPKLPANANVNIPPALASGLPYLSHGGTILVGTTMLIIGSPVQITVTKDGQHKDFVLGPGMTYTVWLTSIMNKPHRAAGAAGYRGIKSVTAKQIV